MQAAWNAAASGARVTLVDAAPTLGGQIWRGEQAPSHTAMALFEKLRRSNVRLLFGCSIVDAPQPGMLLGVHRGQPQWLAYDRLILATGARELFLPFPGWTLPNVFGVGGIQALAKGGLDLKGKRVVVCGSGPLLLSVAAYLRRKGAEIPVLAEQATLASLVRFTAALRHLPGKVAEAFGLARDLVGTGFRTGTYPVRAHGSDRLISVALRDENQEWTVRCNYLACAFGFVPNLELPLLMGCELRDGFVAVDEWQQSTVPHVYCAGEPVGIGGAEKSLAEGAIAGLAAANTGSVDALRERALALLHRRERCRQFAAALDRCFALRDELRIPPPPDTIVCRCEDVPLGHLAGQDSWRAAKLHTRLGMGPCQGRVCGAATALLFGWSTHAVRPPLFPVPVESIATPVPEMQQPG
jgi:NADPH-dependent 2,4-dienoyl-CoA reductase/sulfur reductase-like enzyme